MTSVTGAMRDNGALAGAKRPRQRRWLVSQTLAANVMHQPGLVARMAHHLRDSAASVCQLSRLATHPLQGPLRVTRTVGNTLNKEVRESVAYVDGELHGAVHRFVERNHYDESAGRYEYMPDGGPAIVTVRRHTSTWRAGRKHGAETEYTARFSDGTSRLYERTIYANGVRHGEYTKWNSVDKTVAETVRYVNGLKHGVERFWYISDVTTGWHHGVKHGDCVRYYASGGRASHRTYVMGVEQGVTRTWWAGAPGSGGDGALKSTHTCAALSLSAYVGSASYYGGCGRKKHEVAPDDTRTPYGMATVRDWFKRGADTNSTGVAEAGVYTLVRESRVLAESHQKYDDMSVPKHTAHGVTREWYRFGARKRECSYVNGVKQGVERTWHDMSGMAHGCTGTQRHDEQLHSEGMHVNGRRVGVWLAYSRGGVLIGRTPYNGQGERSGVCETWHDNGVRKRSATHMADIECGPVTVWHANSERAREYTIRNGLVCGVETSWHDNGRLKCRGAYFLGTRTGVCESWHANGQLECRGAHFRGIRTGVYESWHANGMRNKTVTYAERNEANAHRPECKYEKRTGEFTVRDCDGVVTERGKAHPTTGELVGTHTEWYVPAYGKARRVRFTATYADDGSGHRDGVSSQHFMSGKLRTTVTYKHGSKHGDERTYSSTGQLREQTHWAQGARVGVLTKWSAKGKLRSTTTYVDGRKDGLAREYNTDGVLVAEHTLLQPRSGTTRQFSAIIKVGLARTWWGNGQLKTKRHYTVYGKVDTSRSRKSWRMDGSRAR
jgi:antitoxin component YwqK of YwqJK toxin-antitoxin module